MIRFPPSFRLERHSRDAKRDFLASNTSCETTPPAFARIENWDELSARIAGGPDCDAPLRVASASAA
jgi:hypothetical protein